jgi:hypothetical protein
MKRIILLFLLISINTYSQDSFFSVKGGMNYSKADDYSSDYETETSYKFGGVLYLSWEKNIYKGLYFNIDFGVNEKGTTTQAHNYIGGEYTLYDAQNISFWSWELPVILGYKLFNQFKLYIGVYHSLVFSNRVDGKSFNPSRSFAAEYGFLLGLEYSYDKFLFNFRYERAYNGCLYDTSEDSGSIYDNSRQFIFMVGYSFF